MRELDVGAVPLPQGVRPMSQLQHLSGRVCDITASDAAPSSEIPKNYPLHAQL